MVWSSSNDGDAGSAGGRGPRSRTLTAASAAVVLYGVRDDVKAECERVAAALQLAHVHVKHLHAACNAVAAHRAVMVVASRESVRPWDREVLADHVQRAGAPILWVEAADDGDDVAEEVRGWATAMSRAALGRR